jgi:hypothetical protein
VLQVVDAYGGGFAETSAELEAWRERPAQALTDRTDPGPSKQLWDADQSESTPMS